MPARPDVWLIPLLELGAVVLLGWRAVAIPDERRVWWLITAAALTLTTAHFLYRLLLPLALDDRVPWSSTELGLAVHVAKVIFFAATFLALSRIVSRRVGLPAPGVRLDGLIGGCAVLTVGTAVLVPDSIVYALHGWAEVTTIVVAITALAPIALLVGLIPLLGQVPSRVWCRMIIAASLAAFAAAYSLLPMSVGADARSAPSWLLWSAALQALAWTAWDRWPPIRMVAQQKGSIVTPTAFALCAVAVLGTDRLVPQPPIVLSLAFVTVLIAIVRMALALRSAQRLNADHLIQRQRLREARDEAVAAGRARSDFIATLSHEIRTPLTSVIGMNELLMASELNASQREQVEHVRRTGTLILDLVNDVLDLATIDEDQLTLKYQPMELAEVLGDVVELLQVNADAKAIRLRADLDPGLPRMGPRRRHPAPAGADQSGRQRGEVHRRRGGDRRGLPGGPARGAGSDLLPGHRHRCRHAGRPAEPAVPAVQPAPRHRQPLAAGHRPGPVDQSGPGSPDGRRDHGHQPGGSRLDLRLRARAAGRTDAQGGGWIAGRPPDGRRRPGTGPGRGVFADQLRRWGAEVAVPGRPGLVVGTGRHRGDPGRPSRCAGRSRDRAGASPRLARPTLMIITASGFAAPNRACGPEMSWSPRRPVGAGCGPG